MLILSMGEPTKLKGLRLKHLLKIEALFTCMYNVFINHATYLIMNHYSKQFDFLLLLWKCFSQLKWLNRETR